MDEQKPQKFEQSKKLVDSTLINQGVDSNVQKMINLPQMDPLGIDDTDMEYLEKMMKLIETGTIDLFRPETLQNAPIYDKLDEKSKGHVDFNAVNLLGEIRNIKKLWDTGDHESFQIKNLIQRMRQTKQRVEKEHGDCYII